MTDDKKIFLNPSNEYQKVFNEACKRANSPSDITLKVWEIMKEKCVELTSNLEAQITKEVFDEMKDRYVTTQNPKVRTVILETIKEVFQKLRAVSFEKERALRKLTKVRKREYSN